MKHYFVSDTDYWREVLVEVKNNKAYIAVIAETIEIQKLYCCNSVGYQKLEYKNNQFYVRKAMVEINEFAKKNGLSKRDLLGFFKGVGVNELLLIQFTPFRY